MKKGYLVLLFTLTSILILYSFNKYFRKSNENSYSNFNNLKDIITDSINPSCVKNNKGYSDKSIINIKELKIIIPDSRRWSKNILNARLSQEETISNKYKKKFKGFLLFDNNHEICKLKASIRLSGDFKDHIKFNGNDILSSLDVKLDEGNINGIVRFKLFLPRQN